MPTRVAVVIGSEEDAGKSKVFELADSFDTVIERIYPTQQPSSALENRANLTHEKTDGDRVLIPAHHVAWVEEV